MKKILGLVLVLFFVVTLLSGCGEFSGRTDGRSFEEDSKKVKNSFDNAARYYFTGPIRFNLKDKKAYIQLVKNPNAAKKGTKPLITEFIEVETCMNRGWFGQDKSDPTILKYCNPFDETSPYITKFIYDLRDKGEIERWVLLTPLTNLRDGSGNVRYMVEAHLCGPNDIEIIREEKKSYR